jgi:hypothetical protein
MRRAMSSSKQAKSHERVDEKMSEGRIKTVNREIVTLHGGYVNRGTARDPDFREPRTFTPGERFVVTGRLIEICQGRIAPREFALKPMRLYLSEVGVKASAWWIHDVRVNGRSQLDGDGLSGKVFLAQEQRQCSVGAAIVSGFDTIGIGGTLEIEVSFQGARDVDRAPFYAAMIGLEVEHDHDVTEYSGSIRLRGPYGTTDELVAVVCDGPSRVPSGECAWFVTKLKHQSFRPERLAIALDAQDWLIEDLHVDGKTQFSQSGSIPGDVFHPDALDTFVSFEVVPISGSLAIKARYIGSKLRGGRFGMLVHGSVQGDA